MFPACQVNDLFHQLFCFLLVPSRASNRNIFNGFVQVFVGELPVLDLFVFCSQFFYLSIDTLDSPWFVFGYLG